MGEIPKRLQKVLRELTSRARERELREALLPLASDFDAWRAGTLDVDLLLDRIHRFHQGPNREIWKEYTYGSPELLVAGALVDGLLAEEEVPEELLQLLARLQAFYAGTEIPDDEAKEPCSD
jgi:hypothetical protein